MGQRRKLLNLAKIYINNAKHSSHNISFTFKLIIFHNICLRVDFSSEIKIKAFFTMLKNLALNYYYSNINMSGTAINFN